MLDPGEVHDGPPRRTHSIGDLIQRKNKSHFQNCYEILYNVQTIKKSIGYPKHKYNSYWIFSMVADKCCRQNIINLYFAKTTH